MADRKIPKELEDIASGLGCNEIKYIKTTKSEGDIYSLASIDPSTGEYDPIGQPLLYAVKFSLVYELPPFFKL